MRNTLCASFLLMFAVLASTCNAQQEPSLPDRPTFEDCRQIDTQYMQMFKDLDQRIRACQDFRHPHFGWATGCNGHIYTPWTNCVGLERKQCAIFNDRKVAVKTCWDRANALEDQHDENERARKALALRMQKGNDLIQSARNLSSLISDPKSYFINALGKNSPVLKQIFSSDDFRSDSVRPDLAAELYRFAQTYAEEGVIATQNPLIRTIQQRALKRLGEQQKQILQEMDSLSATLNSYRTDLSPPLSHDRILTPSSVNANSNDDLACSVLDDADASRELQQRDPNVWRELSERCLPK